MSAEEIFDVVDEADQVVARAPRSQVHREGLLHRAVHVFVFNAAGEMFLQKRAMSKDTHPGTWDSSASGHLDAGEDYRAAAVREVFEELGVAVTEDALREIAYVSASAETDWEFVRLYSMAGEGPFAWNEDEISDGRFLSCRAIAEWIEREPTAFARAFRTLFALAGTTEPSA